jgi:hypothetical protein
MFDMTDVGFVKRVTLGSTHHEAIRHEDAHEEAAALLNRCLSEHPRGKIIAIEKSFKLLNVGENQVLLQWVCYHIGFARKPNWLEEPPLSAPSPMPSSPHHWGMPPA